MPTKPEKVTCTLYRRCRYLNTEKKKNNVVLIVGSPGTGKSELGLKLCEDMDKHFGKERVVNSVAELTSLINSGLKPGSAILFDEIAGSEEAADSRKSLSRTNTTLSYISTIYRVKRLFVVYCCPFLTQMDKRIRLIGVTAIIETRDIDFKKKRTITGLYWVHSSGKTGKMYTPKPRETINGVYGVLNRVTWGRPSKQLLKDYAEVKEAFQKKQYASWDRQFNLTKENKLNELYLKAREKVGEFIVDKKISLFAIMTKLNATRSQAEAIRATLHMDVVNGRTILPITALNAD